MNDEQKFKYLKARINELEDRADGQWWGLLIGLVAFGIAWLGHWLGWWQ